VRAGLWVDVRPSVLISICIGSAHLTIQNKPYCETLTAFMKMPLDKLKDTFLTFADDYEF
jgi:hypothetical protein